LQQVRYSATVPVWRCWRWSFTVCREGRNTAAMTGLAVLRSWQFPTLRTCEIGHLRNAATLRLAALIVFDDFFSRGESRKCGRGGQKSRFHRHRTRPPGVDDCGRGREDACSRQITETTPRSSRRGRRGGYSALCGPLHRVRLGLGTSSKLAPMATHPPCFSVILTVTLR